MTIDINELRLPPGYRAESMAYGTAVVRGEGLILVATEGRSGAWIEAEAWSHYAESVRDYIFERRVAVEVVGGEVAG